MRKLVTLTAAAAVVGAMILASPPTSAGTGHKVTGGAETITAGGVVFSMTANAIQTKSGLKGHMQYSREAQDGTVELYVHATPECLWVSGDGMKAEMAGPAMVQSNPNGFPTNDWLAVAIEEGGTGFGDAVRVHFVDAGYSCPGESSFPGDVLEGEFKIRPSSE
jgi:hypothetical protein